MLGNLDTTRSGYYVAHADTILGHGGYIHHDLTNQFELVGIVVKKNRQRQGIGISIINALCGQIVTLGGTEVILYTLGHIGNRDTLTFYRRIGFQEVNEEPDYYMPGYHRVTFKKDLSCLID
ncbi:GNAT family N-acetyltransferase [Paenibacillus spongiae]|uniref:GNAT family N-acetyltransferase n=1 Tax=Paenibacillus spongiae TaxID=2909671 RepID=A0ABY5S4F9_9BACL|nr:GNAT family N-acetyltransferase [Paenibacillus spongiae]UVI27762.1 GNAT family N-acetyltransferase [Paenibacillus spongiae]